MRAVTVSFLLCIPETRIVPGPSRAFNKYKVKEWTYAKEDKVNDWEATGEAEKLGSDWGRKATKREKRKQKEHREKTAGWVKTFGGAAITGI